MRAVMSTELTTALVTASNTIALASVVGRLMMEK
jgi:hypothetical protein